MYQQKTNISEGQDQDLTINFDCESDHLVDTIEETTLFGPIACGVIFGYFLISNGTQYPFLLFGLALASYVAIRLLTKSGRANLVAIPATLLSAAFTAGIGYFLYTALG